MPPHWLLFLFRKRIHMLYVHQQRELPWLFPPSVYMLGYDGRLIVSRHVPGCDGSSWREGSGDDFGNLINCECHKLRWVDAIREAAKVEGPDASGGMLAGALLRSPSAGV